MFDEARKLLARLGERGLRALDPAMPAHHPRSTGSRTRAQLGFLALLLVPLLLFLHVPLLAAVIPGALITVASLDSLHVRQQTALPSAEIVGIDDLVERQRIEVAAAIPAKHRRIDVER